MRPSRKLSTPRQRHRSLKPIRLVPQSDDLNRPSQLDAAQPEELQHDRVAVVGQMTLAVAHELSNPLAAIVASAQTMLAFWPRQTQPREKDDEDDPPPAQLDPAAAIQYREDIELILSEARRAGEIVGSLLAFARQQRPERKIVSLSEVVQRAAVLGNNLLQTHNIRLRLPNLEKQKDRVWVRGDSNQLQQVMLNLLVNAQQAITGAGSGSTIEIGFRHPSAMLAEITVEDDGPGIPWDKRAMVFEPFFTTKPAGQGTGLGLPICSEIVNSHGGSLRLEEPESGPGSRFVISLPLIDASQNDNTTECTPDATCADIKSLPAPEASKRPRRLLIVDDEKAILRSVGRFLKGSGYDVETANTGSDALLALRDRQFDAVVCDLRMPGLSGEELFERARAECPEVIPRIVFTSGDLLREESREFVRHSGCRSLQKPYELSDLIDILHEVCGDGGECKAA